jgi:hypothetical protein
LVNNGHLVVVGDNTNDGGNDGSSFVVGDNTNDKRELMFNI